MQERSEEQIVSRLLELENQGQAERRTQLSGERYLSLIQDPDTGRAYVFRHGMDNTEGAEPPPESEFYEYPTSETAAQAYDQRPNEPRAAVELVGRGCTEERGDVERGAAEVRDV